MTLEDELRDELHALHVAPDDELATSMARSATATTVSSAPASPPTGSTHPVSITRTAPDGRSATTRLSSAPADSVGSGGIPLPKDPREICVINLGR